MKFPRLLSTLIALAFLGAMIGYLISIKRPLPYSPEAEPPEFASPKPSGTSVVHDFPDLSDEPTGLGSLTFPANAVEGELVLHFSNHSDFLVYLEALAAAGIQPLGQIDALLAVRIPEQALRKANPGQYGARASFSYQIQRPSPPVEIAPKALASLTAYGMSARAITGGPVSGTGQGVMVAILDSGIEANPQFDDVNIVHLDLTGGGAAGPGAAHGTSVASIIAGREGIAPDSELFVVRVLDEEGLGSSYNVAQGIVQAVDMGAKIINMSLGVYQDTPLLRQAVSYASERGVLMVAPSGNDGYQGMPYPAAYPEVLSVTAVDAKGQQALFPNQSTDIDFAAPGVGVLTANKDQGTTSFTGTSAAAPFVSGTLASLMSGGEALAPKQAVELLQRYLNDQGAPGRDSVYGAGVVDWDRLRERGTTDLLDVALADIYLQSDAQPGTTMPIEVTVQNRGTRWFNNAQLEIFIGDGEAIPFTLGSLGPGQTTTRKVFTQLPSLDSDGILTLAARVMPDNITEDIRPQNNIKAVAFKPNR